MSHRSSGASATEPAPAAAEPAAHSDAGDYYYVRVTQLDGARAWTSPFWVGGKGRRPGDEAYLPRAADVIGAVSTERATMSGIFDLHGKVALVTGGSSGIGLGYAKGLAEAGADVCLWSIDDAANDAASAELAAFGGRVLALHCDVRDEAQIEDAFARTVRELGRVDACFANAGVPPRFTPSAELGMDEWRRMTSIHLEGSFLTLRAAFRHMSSAAAADRGRDFEHLGDHGHRERAALRRGQGRRARGGQVARGSRARGTASAPMPSSRAGSTPRSAAACTKAEAFQKRVLPRIPARRWGTGDDFRAIAVYLASDGSAYHTGDAFVIDGGYQCF